MIILTYVIRTAMVLAIYPMTMLLCAMYQDVKSWGKDN